MKATSKNGLIARLAAVAAGLQQHMSGQTLTFDNGSTTVASLIALFDSFATQVQATASAKAAWTHQVDAEQTLETTQIVPKLEALDAYLRGLYGPGSTVLVDYGIKPKKSPKVPAVVQAAAVEKRQATRAARGTKGSRQKASIHGAAPAATTPAKPA